MLVLIPLARTLTTLNTQNQIKQPQCEMSVLRHSTICKVVAFLTLCWDWSCNCDLCWWRRRLWVGFLYMFLWRFLIVLIVILLVTSLLFCCRCKVIFFIFQIEVRVDLFVFCKIRILGNVRLPLIGIQSAFSQNVTNQLAHDP